MYESIIELNASVAGSVPLLVQDFEPSPLHDYVALFFLFLNLASLVACIQFPFNV